MCRHFTVHWTQRFIRVVVTTERETALFIIRYWPYYRVDHVKGASVRYTDAILKSMYSRSLSSQPLQWNVNDLILYDETPPPPIGGQYNNTMLYIFFLVSSTWGLTSMDQSQLSTNNFRSRPPARPHSSSSNHLKLPYCVYSQNASCGMVICPCL